MGTFAVWCVILYYKPMSGLIGIAWVGVGIVAYVIFRKAQGYSLTKTIKSADAAGDRCRRTSSTTSFSCPCATPS